MLQLKHQTVFLDISSLHGKTVLSFAAVPDAKEPLKEVKNDEFSFWGETRWP
mgnify:CR=1 FL=1